MAGLGPLQPRRRLPSTVLILALLLAAPSKWAAEILWRVVGLSDGDTITVLTSERR
jgi:hypothetical protein